VSALADDSYTPPPADPPAYENPVMAGDFPDPTATRIGPEYWAIATKARRSGTPLAGPAARKFALAFVPAIAAGAIVTFVLYRNGSVADLPGCWLLLYGTAVTSGGALSVGVVPLMGIMFMALGTGAFVAPASWGRAFFAWPP